jgi:integrase
MNCYQAGFRIFAPLWGIRMEDIDIDDLQDCMDDADVGRRTLENAKTALGLVYKYGIPRDAVPKDRNLGPFLRIRESGAGKKTGFSADELEKIRKAAADGDLIARMVLCHCYLGFRPTGLLELTAADYSSTERAFLGGIKTAAGIDRTVTVSPKVQPYVDQFLAAAAGGYVFGQAGKPLPIKKYRDAFYDLLKRLGIDNPVDEAGRHRLTPHSCRHTFATLMKRVKAPDTDKLALIGHTSTDQLREYQDVPFEDLRAITDQL